MTWQKALGLAPALVESGKQLWERMSSRRAPLAGARPGSTAEPSSTAESAAAAQVRLQALEQRVAVLEDEAVASFDVVRSITQQQSQLAEQHAELVHATDALLARTRLLAWAGAVTAVFLLALLAVAIAR